MSKLSIAALALAAAFGPALACAETFESSAAQAFSDSGVVSQSRQSGAKLSADSAAMGRVLMERGDRGRGGDHGGDCCRDHDRGHDRDRGRWGHHDHDRDRDRDRRPAPSPSTGGGYDPYPGHQPPVPGSQPQPSRPGQPANPGSSEPGGTAGHPGHGDIRWQWRQGRPIWWGWTPFVVVVGATHSSCISYYDGLATGCRSACLDDSSACLNYCATNAPGDYQCTAQCSSTYNDCTTQCGLDRDDWGGRCPL